MIPEVKDWHDLPATDTPRSADALEALEFRAAMYGSPVVGPGVFGYEDFRAKQLAVASGMSVDVGDAGRPNLMWIPVDGAGGAHGYYYAGTQLNVPIAEAHATLPRVDQIIGLAPSDPDDRAPLVTVLQGAATGGATIDNRTGAAATPANCSPIADVLVAAGVTSILSAAIRDRRRVAVDGVVPWLLTDRDEVTADPAPGLFVTPSTSTQGTQDTQSSVVMVRVKRRIVAPTRLRWRYRQGGTANTGQVQFAYADASGRIIFTTTIAALTGAAGASVERAEVITWAADAAQVIEPGFYYQVFSVSAMTAGSSFQYLGANVTAGAGFGAGPVTRNMGLRASGTALGATVLGFTDVGGVAVDTVGPAVPVATLSVG